MTKQLTPKAPVVVRTCPNPKALAVSCSTAAARNTAMKAVSDYLDDKWMIDSFFDGVYPSSEVWCVSDLYETTEVKAVIEECFTND